VSRLESAIRRLTAQRACLDAACAAIAGLPGPALELGLGNGRTYSHLLERLPDREVWVFERAPKPHADVFPPEDRLFRGELSATLPDALARIGAPAALAHMDLGTKDKDASVAASRALAPLVVRLLAPGAVVASDQPLDGVEGLGPFPVPDEVPPGRYHMYRRA
jgi:hypothetical protein